MKTTRKPHGGALPRGAHSPVSLTNRHENIHGYLHRSWGHHWLLLLWDGGCRCSGFTAEPAACVDTVYCKPPNTHRDTTGPGISCAIYRKSVSTRQLHPISSFHIHDRARVRHCHTAVCDQGQWLPHVMALPPMALGLQETSSGKCCRSQPDAGL